jgi:hypothetical protein
MTTHKDFRDLFGGFCYSLIEKIVLVQKYNVNSN